MKKFLLFLPLLIIPSLSNAQTPWLDYSFGTNGTIDLQPITLGLAVQPDKKILILERYHLRRYLSNGDIDLSFGINGQIPTPEETHSYLSHANRLFLQGDKIIIKGFFTVHRFNEDGSIDEGFGENGSINLEENIDGNNFFPTDLLILPDGRILIAVIEVFPGEEEGLEPPIFNNYNVVAYNYDGTLDNDFGDNGHLAVSGFNYTFEMAAQPDGNIILFGSSSFEQIQNMQIVRFDPQGNIDASFNNGNVNIDAISGYEPGTNMLILKDGKVLLASGYKEDISVTEAQLQLVRLDQNGNLDLNFGDEGRIVFEDKYHWQFPSFIELNDGRFLLPDARISVVDAFHADGTPHDEFQGVQGVFFTHQGEDSLITISGIYRDNIVRRYILSAFEDKVTKFTLINAQTNEELFEIEDGQVISLSDIGTNEINIRAYTDPEPTGSVRFVLTGPQTRNHIENNSYYALFANDGENFFSWQPPLGQYQLTATPYSGRGAQGEAGAALTVSFSIIDEEIAPVRVERLILINARNNQELFEIEDGQVINLQEIGTNQINIRAYTDPEPTGSVRFVLTGPQNRNHIENNSFYALFANIGNNFFSWIPPLGQYHLTVTPYTQSGAQGEVGAGMAISFSIVNESPEAQRVADVFPNPGTSTLFIPLENQNTVKLLMFDLAGKQVMDKVSLNHYDDRVEINVNGLESKAYIIQLVSDKETRNIRWMKE